MQQLGLWESADHAPMMRPIVAKVKLRGGPTGPGYEAWRKRLVFQLSLMGLTCQDQGGRLVIAARCGDIGLKRRTRVLDWLLAQDDVLQVECAWPRPDEASFSIQVVEARS